MKRIAIASMCGLIAGFVCTAAGASTGMKLTAATVVWILLNRTVMGFVIGASGLRMHWAWNGALIGLVVGSIFSYAAFLFDRPGAFVALTMVASIVFGFLIELFTTVVFKYARHVPTAENVVEIRRAAA